MIDFHSHILPGIDDGSQSAEESVEMLAAYSDQITDVCLTPHFYPAVDEPDRFFERRAAAEEALREKLGDKPHPHLHLGAEVLYYSGIHSSAVIEKFRISGTRLLLVEMPFGPWNNHMMDDLIDMNRSLGLRPVLAHIDRYNFGGGVNRKCLDYFLSKRGLVQVNADAFDTFRSRRQAYSMIRKGQIHFIGSDAHNTGTRKPNMDTALAMMEKTHASDIKEIIEHNYHKYFI